MKLTILIALFFCSAGYAESISLTNRMRFFEKESFSTIQTTPMCGFVAIDINVELPDNASAVQKVYEQIISCNDFDGKIQIFYHQKAGEKYLSQQIVVTNKSEDIAFCSSYFSLDAKFLIPGACVGSFNKKSIGISVFR